MIYWFGPFRYDAEQRLLFRDEELIPLVPKALETLHVLLQHHGRVVEKARLMELVWPDAHVEEVGLARNISLLRKALGEELGDPLYIETVPRRGYRFAAPVIVDPPKVVEAEGERAGAPGQESLPQLVEANSGPRSMGWHWFLGGLGVLLLTGLVYYQFYVPSRYLKRGDSFASLAVIPFECLCPGMNATEHSRGFNEVMVAEIAKLDRVEVLAPSTVRRHQNFGVSTGLMGRLLGLEMLVEGTIQEIDSRLRISARLIDVHTGRVIWAETYEEPADDPGLAQLNVGRAVAAEIQARLQSGTP